MGQSDVEEEEEEFTRDAPESPEEEEEEEGLLIILKNPDPIPAAVNTILFCVRVPVLSVRICSTSPSSSLRRDVRHVTLSCTSRYSSSSKSSSSSSSSSSLLLPFPLASFSSSFFFLSSIALMDETFLTFNHICSSNSINITWNNRASSIETKREMGMRYEYNTNAPPMRLNISPTFRAPDGR